MTKWEQELHTILSQPQRDCIFRFAHKALLANTYQENGYKILTQWYKTTNYYIKLTPR